METWLSSLPPDSLLLAIMGVIFLNCHGLIPSNNDIHLIIGGALGSQFGIPFMWLWPGMMLAMILGDFSAFSIGHTFGPKLLEIDFLKRKLPPEKMQSLKEKLNHNPFKVVLGIRLAPAIKPFLFMSLGILKMTKMAFFKQLATITIVHTFILSCLSYYAYDLIKDLGQVKYLFIIASLVLWFFLVKAILKNNEVSPS